MKVRSLIYLLSLATIGLAACTDKPAPTTPPVVVVPEPVAGRKPVISSFSASPSGLPAGGGSTTLSWAATNTTQITIDGGVGVVTGTSKTLTVNATKTFTLTAENANGSVTATTDITVGVNSTQGGVWNSSNWNEANWQ
jgi:hypothetical protein